MIREGSLKDIDQLVEIHRQALPKDFLPRLGAAFLKNTFYPLVLSSPYTLTLVWEDNKDKFIKSFVIFTDNHHLFTSELLKYKKEIFKTIISHSLADSKLLMETLFNVLFVNQKVDPSFTTLVQQVPELVLIATHPFYQSQGIGYQIVAEGLKTLKDKKYTHCLVKTSSPKANIFYNRLGFYKIGEEYRGNRLLVVLLKPL